mmetsp:Transcript_62153/g.166402  ORF Transcript_62153/g.166402 Transcript_62153/m.166402 type:complete len:369 (+) Transcript_62153:180-1286(+)
MAKISRAMQPLPEGFSVLTWNMLAQTFIVDGKASYHHRPAEDTGWQSRLERLLAELREVRPTVICLQEMSFEHFPEVAEALGTNGYTGVMQDDRKRAPGQPVGAATFFGSGYTMVWDLHRTRTLAIGLSDGQRIAAVVNCHLEGNPAAWAARVSQLKSCLQQVAKMDHHALVVAGDFNAQEPSAAAYFLAGEGVPEGMLEWGYEVPACGKPDHSYALQKVYPSGNGEYTFTISGGAEHLVMLDQIWFSSSLILQAYRDPSWGSEFDKQVVVGGLPNKQNPSDHLPLAATFAWASDTPSLKQEEAIVKAAPTDHETYDQLMAKAKLTPDQMAEWDEFAEWTPQGTPCLRCSIIFLKPTLDRLYSQGSKR